jgi:hypothetical protein
MNVYERLFDVNEPEGKRIMGVNNVKLYCICELGIMKSAKDYQKYVGSWGEKKEQYKEFI